MATSVLVGIGKKSLGFTVQWKETAVLISILLTVTVGSALIMIYNIPLTPIDTWQIHSFSVLYSNGFPVFQGRMVPGYYYPMPIYLSVLGNLSGLPSSLTVQFLYLSFFVVPLSFYAMVKQWFRDLKYRGIPIIAVSLSVTLGFGSIYFLYLKAAYPSYSVAQTLSLASNTAYDIYLRVLYLPSFVAPLWNIGIPVFFMLIYLLSYNKCSVYLKGTLISILFALGYLSHPLEVGLIGLFLLVHSLVIAERGWWKIKIFALLGLFIVLIFDLVAPAQLYVFPPDLSGKPTLSFWYLVVMLLVTSSAALDYFRDKVSFSFFYRKLSYLSLFIVRHWHKFRWLLLYLFGLGLTIWLLLAKNFNVNDFGGPNYFTPFFISPIRFGAMGLIFLFAIMAYFTSLIKDSKLLLFFVWTFLSFILEQVSNFYPFYSSYRFSTFTLIGVCIIAAYGIKNVIQNSSKSTRKRVVSLFLLLMLLPSALGTALFYIDGTYYSYRSSWVNKPELEAVNFIKNNLKANESVLAFSNSSEFQITALAGINPIQDFAKYTNLILSITNPYLITYALGSSNVRYIYVTKSDLSILNSTGKFFESFLSFFSEAFVNNEVTIYEVPILAKPSPTSPLGILNYAVGENFSVNDFSNKTWMPSKQFGLAGNSSVDTSTYSAKDIGMSLFSSRLDSSYTLLDVDNQIDKHLGRYIQNFSNIILTRDPENVSEVILEWVRNGGNLIIFNPNGIGSYGNLLNVASLQGQLNRINLGSGKIFYVNINSISEEELPKTLENIIANKTINSVFTENNQQKELEKEGINAIAEYNCSVGIIQTFGDLKLSTDLMLLSGNIDLKNGSKINSINELLVNGESTLSVADAKLEISPSGQFLRIDSTPNITKAKIMINEDHSYNSVFLDNSSVDPSKLFPNNSMEITSTNLSIYVRSPAVEFSGQMLFNTLWFKSSVQTDTKMQGQLSFSLFYSSDNATFFSELNTNGQVSTYLAGAGTISSHNQLVIPWKDVLISPYNLIFISLSIFGLIYPNLKNRTLGIRTNIRHRLSKMAIAFRRKV